MRAMQRSIWLSGALLLAACSGPTPSGTHEVPKTGGRSQSTVAMGGRTGTGGTTRPASDAGRPGGALGVNPVTGSLACRDEGASCESATDCCAGASCLSTSTESGGYRCKRNCTNHSECQTGCCARVDGLTSLVCLDPVFCPGSCHPEEAACQHDYHCCAGLACAIFDKQTSACKPVCTQGADCPSGCCVPLGQTGVSVCLDAIYCRSATCHEAEEACVEDRMCCDGLTCVIFATDPVTSACKTSCKRNQDCPTGCCVAMGSGDAGACLDKSFCAAP